MCIRFFLRTNDSAFAPEAQNIRADVVTVRPCQHAVIDASTYKKRYRMQLLHKRPRSVREVIRKVERSRKTVAVRHMETMPAGGNDLHEHRFHGNGSILFKGSDCSRRRQLSSNSVQCNAAHSFTSAAARLGKLPPMISPLQISTCASSSPYVA